MRQAASGTGSSRGDKRFGGEKKTVKVKTECEIHARLYISDVKLMGQPFSTHPTGWVSLLVLKIGDHALNGETWPLTVL